MILAILEQRDGVWNRMSFEALEAARQLGSARGEPVHAAVPGPGAAGLAREIQGAERAYAVEHEHLAEYTPDAYTAALAQLIERTGPELVVMPHTYQVRDFAPKLATRFRRTLAGDIIGHRAEGAQLVLVRQYFQGKLNGEVRFTAGAPNFLSVQAGAYRAGENAAAGAEVEVFTPSLDAPRTKPEAPFRESAKEVDLTSASIIVSVGRGIKDKDNLPLVENLAKALGAELAASRPICDNGWLPMERQVGSSGQTVAPKLYVAVGISGAIQHLVGMKGARTIVAINKDPNAPIFEVADYGIVGDLFEVVPAIVEAVEQARK
jgi:electron transfer flavoprotein alpha subunit